MLLPDLDVLPNWVGHKSLGALLMDKATHDRETHVTEHKILMDLRCGKSVSSVRIEKLFVAIISKWRPNDAAFHMDFDKLSLESPHRDAPYNKDGFDWQSALVFWSFLAKNLPKKRRATRNLLEGLVQKSLQLHQVYRNGGIQAFALTLKNFRQHPSAGLAQSRFLDEMAVLIEEGKEDIAQVELAAFGALLIATVFLLENDHSVEATRDSLAELFAADQGRVNPLRSFSHWLDRIETRTGYTKDRLLLDGFVKPNRNAEAQSEQDQRNLLRNPRRYRNGDQIPSFATARTCLRSLCQDTNINEKGKWRAELEQRELGLRFVLLTVNSARSIKKIGGIPERPSQAVYDLFTSRAD
ncbi:hypothetical protein [Marivita sp. S6314]|uniref:hypothetical protein n=1 Tax=Marivita sp. S6314 TaxID=2926406 RepID=UPI001FF10278|nr:hypothetical protein [Marivita sp. S6314]